MVITCYKVVGGKIRQGKVIIIHEHGGDENRIQVFIITESLFTVHKAEIFAGEYPQGKDYIYADTRHNKDIVFDCLNRCQTHYDLITQ